MKIDLHCHTDNTVQGDTKRYVDKERFREVVRDNNIEILAITNHNDFSVERFEELKTSVKDIAQVWPGIELTVSAGKGERHMIIISSPKYTDVFDTKVKNLISEDNPDDVCVDIEKLKNVFDPSRVIYLVHYHDKAKKFYDSEIEYLQEILSDDDLVFLEPTNITSMGIFLDHDMRSIIGSDVVDWDNYPINKLPDLRLRVEDFETFRLLASKDKRVVDKLLSKQDSFKVKVEKYWCREFTFYNDINIIFGGKGTGKTILAEEIYNYLNVNDEQSVKYFNSENATIEFDKSIKEQFTGEEYKKFSLSDFSYAIKLIKNWKVTNPTSLSKYYRWGESKSAKDLEDQFAFINMVFEELIDESDYHDSIETLRSFLKLKKEYERIAFGEKISSVTKETLEKAYHSALNELTAYTNQLFIELYSKILLRKTIDIMKRAVLEKKQAVSKPETAGFYDFYTERVSLVNNINKLKNLLYSKNTYDEIKLGEIAYKGEIYLRKDIIINPSGVTGITYQEGMGKQKVVKIIDSVEGVHKSSFKEDFNEKLSELVDLFEEYDIENVVPLIGRKNSTVLEDMETGYNPSKGEKHMLAINNIILENYDVFVLDEPTVGLGNDYVSNKILPQLKKLVKQDRSYIIVTHDANLGVRSLPYQSIYMQYDNVESDFYVYAGNPFENTLHEINQKQESKNWNNVAQDILEGGEVAFIERRKIYGKE